MKIGRNESCPCGSGKKYKKCCLDKFSNKTSKKSIEDPQSHCHPFFTVYNSIYLFKLFPGLSLIPDNHGKYVRLEELLITSINNYNSTTKIPDVKTIKEFLDSNYFSHHLEDPLVNLFTDLITFYGGDYILFPGMTENCTFILNTLIAAIFKWPNSKIPQQFVVNCKHIILLILSISNTIAERLGYKRYQEGKSFDEKICVPSEQILKKLTDAVTFSTEELKELCNKQSIALDAIKGFLIDINSPELTATNEESPLIYKPIINIDGQFIVISPTTLSLSLVDYIWSYAERNGCMKEVNDAYHDFIWNNLQMQLGQMKFKRINIEGVELNTINHEREGFYQFDSDKIAYVQYLYDRGSNFKIKDEISNVFGKLEENKNHKRDILLQLSAIPEFVDCEILDFTILSPIGRDFIYPAEKVGSTKTLVIPIFELDILYNLREIQALDLWKFSIAKMNQIPEKKILSFSFLDQFKIYRDHQESFYLTDDKKYEEVYIQIGYSDELIKKSKQNPDKHSALKNIKGRLANVQVEKKDKYMPIYVELMGILSSGLEFLIDGFNQAVWIMPNLSSKNLEGEIRNVLWQINDAISYWIWQMQEDIKADLSYLGHDPITITFDLNPIEKFKTIERNFTRDPNLSDKFITSATADSMNITIPAEIIPYLYGSMNEGERVLVEHLLKGINKLLAFNNQPLISDNRILEIINNKVPIGMKKKFFILDSNDNLLLDPTNLDDYRFVQEYDTSIVLNSIIPALGQQCPPVGEIVTQKERNELSFKVVQDALLPLLRSKIRQYDSTELLKYFIGLNESLIRKREEHKIHTPTLIACFESVEQHQKDLHENLSNLNRTTIALRCLIEHVAAEPYKGNKIISVAGVDELIAIMDEIISWGSLSDQIHFNLFDITMSILPSGRIGINKKQMKDVFDPYYISKTKENISNSIATFDQVFPQNINVKVEKIPESLDSAFIKDFGVSFTRICQLIDGLVRIGFSQTNAYASFPLSNLRDEINKYVLHFHEQEFQNAIDYLALTNRGKLESLPKGYEFIDIMPWRFNRMLSFVRKPIVIVDADLKGSSKIVYWGIKQILLSRMYFVDQFFSDRLRVFKNSEVKKVLGKFAQQRGDALVKKIIESINSSNLIIDQDVYIGPGHSLTNHIDIGDIDILIIDLNNRILFSLECKSMSPSRNIKEMIEEVEKLFGSVSEMGWIYKHLRRHQWIETNKQQINKKYNVDITDFIIKSIFITNEDMLTPYLRKQTLPISFITSYRIEEEGYNSLLKLT